MLYTLICFLNMKATRFYAPLSGLILLGLFSPASAELLFSQKALTTPLGKI